MATKTRNRSKGNLFSSEHKPMVEAAQKELRQDRFAERLEAIADSFVAQASKRGIGWFAPDQLTEAGIRIDGYKEMYRLMDRMKRLIKEKAYGLGDFVYKVEWEHEHEDGIIIYGESEIILYRLGAKK
jgi:hypothetical protein